MTASPAPAAWQRTYAFEPRVMAITWAWTQTTGGAWIRRAS